MSRVDHDQSLISDVFKNKHMPMQPQAVPIARFSFLTSVVHPQSTVDVSIAVFESFELLSKNAAPFLSSCQ